MTLQAETIMNDSEKVARNVPPWRALGTGEALAFFVSKAAGLDSAEAARRLAELGPNRLRPPERRGPLARFLIQFHNVLIYVLLAFGAILFFLVEADKALMRGMRRSGAGSARPAGKLAPP